MTRKYCNHCLRPEKVCVCDFITPINNQLSVGILQHPSEQQQVKGTAVLARLSLQQLHFWVAEEIQHQSSLLDWLNNAKTTYLLYPQNDTNKPMVPEIAAKNLDVDKTVQVLVLDGTWKKAYKLLMLNPILQTLPRVVLPQPPPSNYQIRQVKKDGTLSTIEAIYELLSQAEGNKEKFQPLLNSFVSMQNQLMQFQP